jgi:hypothetical protein
MKGTIGISSGKWYWEITVGANTSVGLIKSSVGQANSWPGDSVYGSGGSYGYAPDGQKVTNSSYSAYGIAHTNGNIIGVAYDADNGKLFFALNGTWQASGNPAAGTNAAFTSITGEFSPGLGYWGGSTTNVNSANFGQRPFAYTAPSGFKALCTQNLPAPLVTKSNTVMDVVTYTGTGAALTPTSSLGFNPDWIWIKSRSAATDHALYDVVRGAQARLESNTTDAEVTTDGGVTAFNSAGFTLGTLAQVNTSAATYVAWTWDAGTSTVSNTQGSITSQVRANATAGFSVVTWTADAGIYTVGHGLGVKPAMIIHKCRSNAETWLVRHVSIGDSGVLVLDSTQAVGTLAFGGTNTSTVFYNQNAVTTTSGRTMVAYCFAPVVGYSSFGSYTGNGSSDGSFVYTGFRPRWILIKATSISGESWVIKDSVRGTYNPNDPNLYADLSIAEQTSNSSRYTDFVSNGFKLRGTDAGVNSSGTTYIYAAFAEAPFNYSRAR